MSQKQASIKFAQDFIKKNEINFEAAVERLKKVVSHTPLQLSHSLSKKYNARIFLKREDLQVVRSYKLRGAYNMMCSLSLEQLKQGVVCASAGNHAQGFAYSCKKMNVPGVIFMPTITPKQKIQQTKMFGDDMVEIKLVGDNFDECAIAAKKFMQDNHMIFIPPFNDNRIIEGQGTVAHEILSKEDEIDYIFVPVGGGGLASGVGLYFKTHSPNTKIIGIEPEGAPAMYRSLERNTIVKLKTIDTFVDGAAVKEVGDITFHVCQNILDDMRLVAEGKVCSTILQLYNENAIVVEPAGALSIAALDDYAAEIKNKTVVCVVSGSNNDIARMPEIKERSLQYEKLKHYFLIQFVQRSGALRDFLNNALGPNDDITRFEYMQKTNKEMGPALVGIELTSKDDYEALISRMHKFNINFTEINKDNTLYGYLI